MTDLAVETGPCTPWITGDDLLADSEGCGCDFSVLGTDSTVADDVAEISSDVLFELSGRQFRGECGPVTVRPYGVPLCRPPEWSSDTRPRLSEVKLAGYPVREITEVKIDGVVVAASGYRLDHHRKLVRMRDPLDPNRRVSWPSHPILDLDDTEEGTWSVTYTYGADPPEDGIAAAKALACQLAAPCLGAECTIPEGVVKVVRTGVTIERQALATFLRGGQSGIVEVDTFLAAYNPYGHQRRPSVLAVDRPYPRRVG